MLIITGRSSIDKSLYLYDKINEDKKNNIETVLFVPSQMRQIVEEEYIYLNKTLGIIDFKITTIDEYIKKYISKKNISSVFLNKLDKKVLVSRAILDTKFNIFKNVYTKPRFFK